jgi:TatD DNase family protein
MLIDSHCHLDSDQFDADREQVIERALGAGVSHMVAIGTGNGPPDLEAGIRLAEKYEFFYATVGVHPHDASKKFDEKHLADLVQHPKVVAIGEIGLDYHYDFSPREVQRAVFIQQMQIASNAKKPIVIHTREAWDDTIQVIRDHWDTTRGGIMHCFSGNPEQAKQALDLDFYLSFGGIVTFPKALEIQESARQAPIERILVETDAPYLAPVPKRGKRNEPAFMIETVRKLAQLRGVSDQAIADSTTKNFHRLCNL